MAELETDPFVSDPFVSTEVVEVDEETLRILDERMADDSPLISAEEARAQINEWLTNYATTKKR